MPEGQVRARVQGPKLACEVREGQDKRVSGGERARTRSRMSARSEGQDKRVRARVEGPELP